jgi:uncharacterized lipoprotein YddW (UPF0748 family)
VGRRDGATSLIRSFDGRWLLTRVTYTRPEMGTPRNIVLVAILAVLAALILPAVRSNQVEQAQKKVLEQPANASRTAPVFTPKPRATAQTPKLLPIQLRGLWVDAFGPGFKTPLEVDKLVRDAQAMRVNALFVQVSRRADCYCNKASMPRTADPTVPVGFDPLQDVIDKAHAAGIQVHAWIISTSVWNKTVLDYPSTHPFKLHGPNAKGRENWLTVRADGETRAGADYVLDPGHPDAAEFVANMYSSVVQNYAVDGVQFDRIRYPDSGGPPFLATWGYNPTALERFRLEANRTDLNPNLKPGVADPQWLQWRRDQVTNLVRRVYLEVKSIRPSVWVSAATITYREAPTNLEQFEQTRTYSEILQDWPAWMREGILDLNIPMNYKREREPDQVKWFDGWNQFAVQQKARGRVAVGTANYLNSQADGVVQLKRGLNVTGMDGWVGYSYRTPDSEVNGTRRSSLDGQKLLGANLANTFTATAGWDAPSQQFTAIFGRVTNNGLGQSNARLELQVNGRNDAFETFSDANGYYGFLDVPQNALTLTASGATGSSRLELEAPTVGVVKIVPNLEMP